MNPVQLFTSTSFELTKAESAANERLKKARRELIAYLESFGALDMQMTPDHDQDTVLIRVLRRVGPDHAYTVRPKETMDAQDFGLALCPFIFYHHDGACTKLPFKLEKVKLTGQPLDSEKPWQFPSYEFEHARIAVGEGEREAAFETFKLSI